MHAVITAGGAPKPGEPLYAETQGGYKALLPILGRPMIQWVLDALGGSEQVGQVVVVGLPADAPLSCRHPLHLLPDQGDMFLNLACGVEAIQQDEPGVQQVLAISSDIPAITPEIVDWMIAQVQASDHDFYYNVIERETMETRFPGSRRTYLRLKDREVCGGDLNAVRASAVARDNPVYTRLIAARKSPLKLAALLGLDLLLLLLLHAADLQQVAGLASRRLGIRGRALVCPYAELGMDVDKPHQLVLLQGEMEKRLAV